MHPIISTTHFWNGFLALNSEVKRVKPAGISVCSGNYSTRYKLEEHLRTHTKERMLACPTCMAQYSSKTTFSDHRKRQLKTHSKPKPPFCWGQGNWWIFFSAKLPMLPVLEAVFHWASSDRSHAISHQPVQVRFVRHDQPNSLDFVQTFPVQAHECSAVCLWPLLQNVSCSYFLMFREYYNNSWQKFILIKSWPFLRKTRSEIRQPCLSK